MRPDALRRPWWVVLTLLLVLTLLAPAREEPKAALRREVERLVEQLGDADPAKQAAAATALLKIGPDALPLLPDADPKLTVAQKERLKEIRGTLRDAQARKDLTPHLFDLHIQNLPLKAALAELERQSAIKVDDRRRSRDEDPKVKLELHQVTFWQALDALAREADLQVTFYHPESRIALVDGPSKALPVSYSGIFRVAVKQVVVSRDLESDAHVCQVHLEIAWEPRFQPLFLETQPDSLTVQDDKANPLKPPDLPPVRLAVARPGVTVTQVRVEAPARSAERIGLLKGSVALVGPSKMLTFVFDDLGPVKGGKPGQPRKQTREGVTVSVNEFTTEDQRWTVGLLLEYPPEDPDFESFESWLVNNKIYLEKKGGTDRFPENGGYESEEQGGHRAVMTYRFVEENGRVLGKPADWKLVYQTPGTIIKVPVPFEFKDLPLP
jgi:hypothetical protein